MSQDAEPRFRLPELSADTALKGAAWLVSVAVLNWAVGSPVTDLYVGFSLVLTVFWFAWKMAGVFDAPPNQGDILLRDTDEGTYRGRLEDDGSVFFRGPEGRCWTGSAWDGRWTLEDSEGGRWWGRVGRRGSVRVHDEEGRELRGKLTPEG